MEKLLIAKIGGNIIDNEGKLNSFLSDFASISEKKILIHGGGKIATELSQKLGIETKMVDGRRITDAETIKIVTMVYAGLINKTIVAKLQAKNCNAIGLCGADANIIPSTKRTSGDIDYGFVGDVDEFKVQSNRFNFFIDNDLTPVIAPITHDEKGNLLNTNADTIASILAVALSKIYDISLFYCFEKNGVLKNPDDNNSWFKNISDKDYIEYKSTGVINKGMIPKLDNAFSAKQKGVKEIYICHADNIKKINSGKEIIGTQLN